MSHPAEYIPFRDHIVEHAEQVRATIISHAKSVDDCGDPGCKWPAFWDGLSDQQLEGAAIVLSRLTHEMGHQTKANAEKFVQFIVHLAIEQMRRDGDVLNWTCLSEGAKS